MPSTANEWLAAVSAFDVVALVAIASAFVTFLVKVGRPIVKLSRAVHDFIDDWRGTPEVRDGSGRVIQEAEPGVLARLTTIEHEVKPNHGSSAHDQLMKAIIDLKAEFRTFADESSTDRAGLHERINKLGPPHNVD